METRKKVRLNKDKMKKIISDTSKETQQNIENLQQTLIKHEDHINSILEICANAKIRILKNDYNNTNNPLFLWELTNLCLSQEKQLPKVAEEYLIKCSRIITTKKYDTTSIRYEDICDDLDLAGHKYFDMYHIDQNRRV